MKLPKKTAIHGMLSVRFFPALFNARLINTWEGVFMIFEQLFNLILPSLYALPMPFASRFRNQRDSKMLAANINPEMMIRLRLREVVATENSPSSVAPIKVKEIVPGMLPKDGRQ
ncbi:MAG: hypothetical protein M0C28_30570 [Candidatus Moduliflexus flocculans]|nr:hypothetical protein [Candidatus Moduliflexus flocculans]